MTEFLANLALRARGGGAAAPLLAPDAAARPADVGGAPPAIDAGDDITDDIAIDDGVPQAPSPLSASSMTAAATIDAGEPAGGAKRAQRTGTPADLDATVRIAPIDVAAPSDAGVGPSRRFVPSAGGQQSLRPNAAPRTDAGDAAPGDVAAASVDSSATTETSATPSERGSRAPATRAPSRRDDDLVVPPDVASIEPVTRVADAAQSLTHRSSDDDAAPPMDVPTARATPRSPDVPGALRQRDAVPLSPAEQPMAARIDEPRHERSDDAGTVDVRIGRVEVRFDRPRERPAPEPPSRPAGFTGWELARRHLDRRWL